VTFNNLTGLPDQPIVIINKGDLVTFEDLEVWSGFLLKECRYIKITGTGSDEYKYGFKLAAFYSGVNFSGECSNCEVEFVEIDHEGFVGIQAKEDYHGSPPDPIPVFEELVIHDNYIHNVTEGMYLGETVSPGMEFRHVKIYNNIIVNTGREGIQIANMVEDVEVYNNLILQSGNDSLFVQGNNIQVGDNSVADIYNNITIDALEYGVIVFGSGHINVFNNFIENSQGIFIDDRDFTNDFTSISVFGNYFNSLSSEQVVLNYNELNDIVIQDNYYNDDIAFYSSNCNDCTNTVLLNNEQQSISSLLMEDTEGGVFVPSTENDSLYGNMGPQTGVVHHFNAWPEFVALEDFYIDAGGTSIREVVATVDDNDSLSMNFEGLPDFVSPMTVANGVVELNVETTNDDIGIYEATVTAKELGNGVEVTESFEIVIRNANNQAPVLEVESSFSFSNLLKNTISFSVIDPDDDLVEVSCIDLPSFVSLVEISNSSYQLQVAPGYLDQGDYVFQITADDGFGEYDEKEVSLSIEAKELTPGQVLYRINFGGPELMGLPINWEDGSGTYTNYSAEDFHSTGSYSWKGDNTTQAPDSLFGPYSYCETDSQILNLQFDCEPAEYVVRLYFCERESDYESDGATVLNVYVDDSIVVSDLNISDSINFSPIMSELKVVVSDSLLQLNFQATRNVVKINGLEILLDYPENSLEEDPVFFVFPNPFIDQLFILNDDEDPVLSWKLSNSSGSIVSLGQVDADYYQSVIELQLSSLTEGIYYITITTSKGAYTQKMIRSLVD
jgi:hypothetical protein